MATYIPAAWDNANPLPTTKAKTADAEFRAIKEFVTAIPQVSFSANLNVQKEHAGKHFYHPSADTTARTVTFPLNATIPIRIGSAFNIINDTGAGVVTIAATAGVVLVLAGTGVKTTIALAANGACTLIKIGTDRWMVTGVGLS